MIRSRSLITARNFGMNPGSSLNPGNCWTESSLVLFEKIIRTCYHQIHRNRQLSSVTSFNAIYCQLEKLQGKFCSFFITKDEVQWRSQRWWVVQGGFNPP